MDLAVTVGMVAVVEDAVVMEEVAVTMAVVVAVAVGVAAMKATVVMKEVVAVTVAMVQDAVVGGCGAFRT